MFFPFSFFVLSSLSFNSTVNRDVPTYKQRCHQLGGAMRRRRKPRNAAVHFRFRFTDSLPLSDFCAPTTGSATLSPTACVDFCEKKITHTFLLSSRSTYDLLARIANNKFICRRRLLTTTAPDRSDERAMTSSSRARRHDDVTTAAGASYVRPARLACLCDESVDERVA